MKQILLFTFCIFSFQITFGQVHRAPEMETDRPSKAENASVVPQGYFQVEAGFNFERDKRSGREYTSYHFPETDFRIGPLEKLELRLHAEAARNSASLIGEDASGSATGISNTGIGFKLQLLELNQNAPAIALLGNVTLPLGSKAFNSSVIEPEIKVLFKNNLSDNLSLNYMVGIELEEANPGELGDQKYNKKPGYAINLDNKFTENLGAFIEFYGEKNEGEPFKHSTDGGLYYKLKTNLQLDLSAGVGLAENAPDFFIDAGISFRLPE